MGHGFLLPPDPHRDPIADEVALLRAQHGRPRPKTTYPNGRFLPPGTVSKKAQQSQTKRQEAAQRQRIEADMTGATPPPPAFPTLSSDPARPMTPEEKRGDQVRAWRARKRGQPSDDYQDMKDRHAQQEQDDPLDAPPSEPAPAHEPFPEPTPVSGPCDSPVFLRLNARRILLECSLQGPHPNQPHMHQLVPVEDGDTVFVGWWHANE